MSKKILSIGTHPENINGYSKVIFNILKNVDDTEFKIVHYGFQKSETFLDRQLSKHIIFDAGKYETPKLDGFNINFIEQFVQICDPDIIFIFNDPFVVCTFIERILNVKHSRTKIVVYIDQVYEYIRHKYIDILNKYADHVCVFSEFWKQCIQSQGLTKNISILGHGYDKSKIFTIEKSIATQYFNLDSNSFYILNLNRNQPRKRMDIFVLGVLKFLINNLQFYQKFKVLLIFNQTEGCYDLQEIFDNEAKLNNVQDQLKFDDIFLFIKQNLTDDQINILYNVADIGVNTCDGEGFGLCNFEHALCKKPQIISNVGNFKNMFDNENSIKLNPIAKTYLPNDKIGGISEIVSSDDLADALSCYLNNEELRTLHGNSIYKKFEKDDWISISTQFKNIMNNI
tara:strand:+ start:117 stop:1313 length:1197 start_codon:yes stop_codon:yes gene_type:complete